MATQKEILAAKITKLKSVLNNATTEARRAMDTYNEDDDVNFHLKNPLDTELRNIEDLQGYDLSLISEIEKLINDSEIYPK